MTIRYLGKLPLLNQLKASLEKSTIDQEIAIEETCSSNQQISNLPALFKTKNEMNYFKFLSLQYKSSLIDIKYFAYLIKQKFSTNQKVTIIFLQKKIILLGCKKRIVSFEKILDFPLETI